MANPIEATIKQTLVTNKTDIVGGKSTTAKNILQKEQTSLPDIGSIIATAIAAVGSLNKQPAGEIKNVVKPQTRLKTETTAWKYCYSRCPKQSCLEVCTGKAEHDGPHSCNNGHTW